MPEDEREQRRNRLAAAVQGLPPNRRALLEDLMQRQAYTVPEVAAALALSVRTVWRLIDSGDIRAIRLGTSKRPPVRVPAAELIRLLGLDSQPGSDHAK